VDGINIKIRLVIYVEGPVKYNPLKHYNFWKKMVKEKLFFYSFGPKAREAAYKHFVKKNPQFSRDKYYQEHPYKSETVLAFLAGCRFRRGDK
jgi:hypothetical protein